MIFGSTAIKHFYPEFRTPSDLDLMDRDEVITREVQKYWVPTFEEIISISKNKEYLDPDLLLTIKASHANWNIHWDKTMFDILFLKRRGHKINVPIYKKLVKDWTKVHGKCSAPLKGKTAKTFFEDAVKRKYIHDDIHEVMAFYNEPLYKQILKHGEKSVECCEKKFDKLNFEDKIKLIKEEIYVTALERYIIPNESFSAGLAYQRSLKKFVTTMSSGWISLWMIDNFELIRKDSGTYVQKFREQEHNCRKHENRTR